MDRAFIYLCLCLSSVLDSKLKESIKVEGVRRTDEVPPSFWEKAMHLFYVYLREVCTWMSV